MSKHLGGRAVLATASGRGALYHLLKALPQLRVIVPAYTCSAVYEAIALAGKTAVAVDVEPGRFNACSHALTDASDADSVIVATHQFGIPCDIEQLMEGARSRGAFVVEDCAAAMGTCVGTRPVGTFGDAAFFSFDCSKLITVPLKGGALAIKDDQLAKRVRLRMQADTRPMSLTARWRTLAMAAVLRMIRRPAVYALFHMVMFRWARRVTAENGILSTVPNGFYTCQLAEWQARIASRQLEQLDALIKRRRALHVTYLERLEQANVRCPPADEHAHWSMIRFPILVEGDKLEIYHALGRLGVDCAFSFTHLAPCSQLPHASAIAGSILNLPMYHDLSRAEVDQVVEAVCHVTGVRQS